MNLHSLTHTATERRYTKNICEATTYGLFISTKTPNVADEKKRKINKYNVNRIIQL